MATTSARCRLDLTSRHALERLLAILNGLTHCDSRHAAFAGMADLWLSSGDHEERERPEGQSQAERAGGAVRRVLIVEDEIFIAWHLEDLVKSMNHEVCGITARGEDAVARLSELSPDLILMDVNLAGGIDGIEAARRINATAAVPIIFITAYGDEYTLAEIDNAAPGSPVLQKPIAPERLSSAVEALLSRRAN